MKFFMIYDFWVFYLIDSVDINDLYAEYKGISRSVFPSPLFFKFCDAK